jgi:SP family sugar porter-like MFS transporter
VMVPQNPVGFTGHDHIGIHTGFKILLLTVTAIAFYSFSLAPVTWVLLSEIFPNRIRGAAMAVAVSALWVGCFTLSYSFPSLNEYLGSAKTFWLYGLICLCGFAFISSFRKPRARASNR